MKIIALFPVKNENWILNTTIPQLKLITDEILCLDGGSTDGTIETLKSYGAQVREQSKGGVNYSSWRSELLAWGRELGGTHFIWLDADEAFTSNFLPICKEEISKLKPGQKLMMQWLCLWKSPYNYRQDNSVWSNLFKDFVFCDDGTSMFPDTKIHEGRTPGPNVPENWITLPLEKGAVLHYQFAPFERFQIKQAFQRCRELAVLGNTPRKINRRYEPTLDDPSAKTVTIPDEWLTGIKNLDSIKDDTNDWYHAEIIKFFESKGIEFFEPLQIWHIDKYRKMFVDKMNRQPKPKTYPKILIWLNDIKNKLKGRK